MLLWARGVALDAGLDVRIEEPDVSPLQIQGPKARLVVQALFGDRGVRLPYYHFVETALDGIPVAVTRTGWTGEVGYEMYLRDGGRGTELWDRVIAAVEPHGIRPTGPSDIRRIEAGILNWGADITLDNNPYEVGLERLVDEDKRADFIGRDALRQIKAAGAHRPGCAGHQARSGTPRRGRAAGQGRGQALHRPGKGNPQAAARLRSCPTPAARRTGSHTTWSGRRPRRTSRADSSARAPGSRSSGTGRP